MEAKKRIGDYEILGELGSGGMGRVFRVRNVISDRVEAMKVLLPDLVGRQDLAARFLREIKVLAALNHPNIAALRTALTADNQLVMIMEYVEGQSVADRLAQGPIATADAIKYIDQVLDALSYAHAQGVVHRDIKPANMMLTPGGVVKVTDFGIARSAGDQTITVAGTTTGSLSYMSPEQVNGDATDPRSDLYSVGVSLYEMVTGERPFKADSDFAVMLAHLKQAPRPPIELQPWLAPGLNEIILRSIAKNPSDRFQSADEFRQALKALPAVAPSVASSRDTTVLASAAARPTAAADASASATPNPHASATGLATDRPRRRSMPEYRLARRRHRPIRSGSLHRRETSPPGLYMALGGVLVMGALIGTGVYLRKAEGGTNPSSNAGNASGSSAGATSAKPALSPTFSARTRPGAHTTIGAATRVRDAGGSTPGRRCRRHRRRRRPKHLE